MPEPKKRLQPLTPLPSAITGREDGWEIIAAPPLAEEADLHIARRQMRVPVGDSEMEQAIRAHEMGHAKWSLPPDEVERRIRASGPRVTSSSLAAAEEFRINELLNQAGISMEHLHNPLVAMGDATRLVLGRNWHEFIQHIARWHGTGVQDYLAATLTTFGDLDEGPLKRVIAIYQEIESFAGRPLDFGMTIQLAQYLDQVGQDSMDPWRGRGAGAKGAPAAGARGPRQQYDSDSLTKSEKKLPRAATGDGSRVPWGTMRIDAVPLDHSLAGRWARKRIAEEEGAIPRAMHRLTSDGRVFDRRVRKMGGTILIDVSGSMSLSESDVYRVVEAAPGCTIAIYAGSDRSGELRVIARNGRVASSKDMHIYGGGNIVDGPALEWLIHEEAPRVWVSDGVVTGVHDDQDSALDQEATRLASMGDVLRIRHVSDTVEYLKTRKKELKRT